MMKTKFAGLDILRFGLAIYLMVFHTVHFYAETDTLPFNALLGVGGMATSSFFILSGFILAHVYFGSSSTVLRGGARDFLVKRLTNLYPIQLISLALLLIVLGGGHDVLTHYSWASIVKLPQPVAALGPTEALFNHVLALLMLDTWNPLYDTLNPPAWSLSVLLFFYLCFPIVAPRLLGARRQPRVLFLIWIVYLIPPIIAGAMHWYGPPVAGLVETNPILRLPEFLAGIVFYGMYRDGVLQALTRHAGWRLYSLAFVAICFCGAAWLIAYAPLYWQYILHNGGMMPAELLLLLVFAEGWQRPSARFATIAARLGNAALSIFAIHLAVFYLFVKVQKFVASGVSVGDCFHDVHACTAAYKAATPTLTFYPLYLVATVLIAIFFQEVIVVKVRDALRRRLLKGASTAHADAAAVIAPSALTEKQDTLGRIARGH